jgi:prepilin-type processing-associated H-X9-DG protein
MRLSKLPLPCAATQRAAFTLIELLAIVATLAILFALATRGLTNARDGSQTLRCLNNHRQLVTAWLMYTSDNAGRLPGTMDKPWVKGWLDWTGDAANTNSAFLTEDQYSCLAKYLNRDPQVFQCPADTYVSPVQKELGWSRRARSYVANDAVACISTTMLDYSVHRPVNNINKLVRPGPGNTFVFIEAHPDSINDSNFYLPIQTRVPDFPATHHNGACAVTFADGHSEVHYWAGSAVVGRASRVLFEYFNSVEIPLDDPDRHWLSFHSPRITDKSY